MLTCTQKYAGPSSTHLIVYSFERYVDDWTEDAQNQLVFTAYNNPAFLQDHEDSDPDAFDDASDGGYGGGGGGIGGIGGGGSGEEGNLRVRGDDLISRLAEEEMGYVTPRTTRTARMQLVPML